MAELHIVIGLPGSGKSRFLKQHARPDRFVVEDYFKDAFDDSPDVDKSRYYRILVRELTDRRTCYVADIAFCDPERLKLFVDALRSTVPQLSVLYHYFKNDAAACRQNVVNRACGKLKADIVEIDRRSEQYVVPVGAEAIKVHMPDG